MTIEKKGLFTTVMMIFGSMVGAGLLVVPSKVMHYGFSSICGWIIAALCSCVLGAIFSYTAVQDPDNHDTLTSSTRKIYGDLMGFFVCLYQLIYINLGVAVVMITFNKYFNQILCINNKHTEFALCSGIMILFIISHSTTKKSFDILKILTVIKLIFFGSLSVLGLICLNPAKLIGMPSDIAINFSSCIEGIMQNINKFGIAGMFTCASISLFAFAGLEGGVQDLNSISNPKSTVPKATMISIILASVIFICTYIFAANQVSGISTDTPIKDAMEKMMVSFDLEQYSGYVGKIVAIIASLGCLGTVLALTYLTAGIAEEGYLIIMPHAKTYKTKSTSFPTLFGIFCALFVIFFIYYGLFISMDCLEVIPYFIVGTYFHGVLLSIKKQPKNRLLNTIGIITCIILLTGCDRSQAIYFIIANMIGASVFAIFKKQGMHIKEEKNTDQQITH